MVATVLVILASPLLALAAAAILLDDGRPVIFRQQRVGQGGRMFTIYKFRSMPVSTPHLPSAAGRQLPVTRVGRTLRRTNVDELPQLWNILKGDMSLIGPRPALPTQTSLLSGRGARGIMRLRPGLTGLAQVNAYDGMSELDKLEWESRYACSVSLSQDFRILVRTLTYLMRRPPVY